MIDLIKDFFDAYIIKFRFGRFSTRDRFANIRNNIKWHFIKLFKGMEAWSPKEKPGYTLVFEENFEKENWDRWGEGKWKIGEGWGLYHPGKPNVHYGPPELDVEKKLGRFTTKYSPKTFISNTGEHINVPYEVSLLSSEFWFTKRYGRFECRMTLPDAPKSFPAFWLWGAPPYGEIDIYEGSGRRTGKTVMFQDMNLHWVDDNDKWNDLRTSRIKLDRFKDFPGKFYEFALEWTPDKIEIFTNGYKVFEYTNKEIIRQYFSHPLWIIINNSIQPSYKKINPDYYSEFYVDYIRVYDIKK